MLEGWPSGRRRTTGNRVGSKSPQGFESLPFRHFFIPNAVFLGVLLLDLSVRSQFFNFDGIACAVAVELSDFKHLVHGNHLAYGLLSWLFDGLWRLLGYHGRAILPLQVLSSLLGAAGAAVFASILRRAGRSEREALLGAAALAVCQAWWFWSLEAQVYMLGALFAALAAREVLRESPRPAASGLWLALAVLGHVGHVMALPALAWGLTRAKGRRALLPAASVFAATVLAAYAAAGLLAVRPQNPEELRLWLLGSAALGGGRSFLWHSAPMVHALSSWSLMTLRIFCEFVGRQGPAWAAGMLLAAAPLVAACRGALLGGRPARFWLMWLAGYAALYLVWEPFTIVYRISDLLGFGALAWLGLDGLSARRRTTLLSVWIATAGIFNFTYVILPASSTASNEDLGESRLVAELTPENAWVLAWGRGEIYFPYFARRKPLSLRYVPNETALAERLDALAKRGEQVYATSRTLDLSGVRTALERHGLEKISEVEGLTLYIIKGRASRKAAAGRN